MVMQSVGEMKLARWVRDNLRVVGIASSLAALKAIVLFLVFPLLLEGFGRAFAAETFPDRYDLLAENLIAGLGFRLSPDTSLTMLRTPGFVFPLAGLFYFFGKSLFAAQIMNFLASCATAILVFCLSMKAGAGRAAAWAAAICCFFFPGTIIAETRGGVESLLMLGIVSSIFLFYLAEERWLYRYYVFLGAVFGYTLLIKPSVALMLPLICLYQLARRRSAGSLQAALSRYSVAGLVAAMVYTPWIVRNYAVSGEFVPTMTAGGMAIDQGVYIVKNYTFSKPHGKIMREADDAEINLARDMGLQFRMDDEYDWYPMFYNTKDEYRFYKKIGEDARAEYFRSPGLLGKVLLVNSLAFWFQGRTGLATLMNVAVTLPILLLGVIGVAAARSRRWDYVPLLIAIPAYVLPHLFIISLARYYIPIVPLISVLAGAGFVAAFQTVGRSIEKRAERTHSGAGQQAAV